MGGMAADPRAEIEKLRAEIRRHDQKYYVEAAPEITDLEYDRLVDRLQQLEARHPELITPDSPTQRIGDQPVSGLTPVTHRVPMLSIDNTYTIEELRKYGEGIAKKLPGETVEWVVELKIDGVAVALIYEQGHLVCGVTRGNGSVGDDVTHNVRTLRDVPLRLPHQHPPAVLEVRGEVYMTNSDLVLLNRRAAAQRANHLRQHAATASPAAFACSTRGSPPSAGCGCSVTASAMPQGCGPTTTRTFWRRLPATVCPSRPTSVL